LNEKVVNDLELKYSSDSAFLPNKKGQGTTFAGFYRFLSAKTISRTSVRGTPPRRAEPTD
jgi:hypothetical protein